jgi:hypothetical protein
MIASLKRHASRVALDKTKFIVSVRVTQVVVSRSANIEDGSILTLCFHKGGKISTSAQILFNAENSDVNPLATHDQLSDTTISINERLDLLVTLYRTRDTRIYQKRTGKLVLRQLQHSSSMAMDAYKAIGTYELQLDELAKLLGSQKTYKQEMVAQLSDLQGCTIHMVITIRAALSSNKSGGKLRVRNSLSALSFGRPESSKGDDFLETRSSGSADSEDSTFSTLGATFYYDDFDQFDSGGADTVVNTHGALGRQSLGNTTISPIKLEKRRRSLEPGATQGDDPSYTNAGFQEEGSFRNLAGPARRRSSGLHLMEVALQEGDYERTTAKSLHKRPAASKSHHEPGAAEYAEDNHQALGNTEPHVTTEVPDFGDGGHAQPARDTVRRSTSNDAQPPPALADPAGATASPTARASAGGRRSSFQDDWAPVLLPSHSKTSSPMSRGSAQHTPYGSPVCPFNTSGFLLTE